MDKLRVTKSLGELVYEAFQNADTHGFHDDLYRLTERAEDDCDVNVIERTFLLEQLAKIAGEVGEAVDAIQRGNRAGFEEELADVLIRVFDVCGLWNIPIARAVLRKMAINRSRPFKHGKEC